MSHVELRILEQTRTSQLSRLEEGIERSAGWASSKTQLLGLHHRPGRTKVGHADLSKGILGVKKRRPHHVDTTERSGHEALVANLVCWNVKMEGLRSVEGLLSVKG